MTSLITKKARLEVFKKELITSDSVQVFQVQFTFDEEWQGYAKTVVFSAGPNKRSVVLANDTDPCTIPWEVLQTPCFELFVGVRGTNDSGDVLPTIWCNLGPIAPGVTMGEEGQQPPTPGVYDQILEVAQNAVDIAQSVRDDADEGKFEGEPGPQGEPGVTPHIGANNHWFIGDTDTGIVAEGQDGTDGTNGITPHIGENGNWFIGEQDTGVHAQGPQGIQGIQGPPGQDGINGTNGQDGQDGITPHIGDNGNWYIGDIDTNVHAQGPQGNPGTDGQNGEDGGYYQPSVSDTGDLAWTASKTGMPDVTGTNIRGPQGVQGVQGEPGQNGTDGTDGENGATFTPSVSPEGVISWTNDKQLDNPESVNIKGPQGTRGENGYYFTPDVSQTGNLSWTNNGGLQNPSTVNIKGPQGEPGKTPEKGVDYWTEADKQEIVAATVAALPVYNGEVQDVG